MSHRLRNVAMLTLAVAFVALMAYWRISYRMSVMHVTAWQAFWL